MLKKDHRLSKASEVKLTFSKGRSFFSPYFTVKYLRKPQASLPRFTVIVSTKVSKKAVVRNRHKRIVREWLRQNLSKFQSGDYVVSVKPKAEELTSAETTGALLQLLRDTKLIV